jgi:hypothetical protein
MKITTRMSRKLRLWANFDPQAIDPTTSTAINRFQSNLRTNLLQIGIENRNPSICDSEETRARTIFPSVIEMRATLRTCADGGDGHGGSGSGAAP